MAKDPPWGPGRCPPWWDSVAPEDRLPLLKTLQKKRGKSGVGSKYHNKPIVIDGFRFDSQKEGARYRELKLLLKAGKIRDLKVHPKFKLTLNGVDAPSQYEADFVYVDCDTGDDVVEDVKGYITSEYKWKRWAMKVVHDVDILET